MKRLGYELISIICICSLFTSNLGYAVEPSCSRFPYEEALLEKMVRLEFSVEKMFENMKEIKAEVKIELDKIKSERELIGRERNEFDIKLKKERGEIDDKVSKMESESTKNLENLANETESKLAMLEKDVKDNLQHAEGVITRMSKDLHELRNDTIQDILDKTRRTKVLFRANNLADLSPSDNQILVFQTILDNQGDGYNRNSGQFSAPVSGEYLFSIQLCTYSSNEFNFSFMQDGEQKQRIQLENHNYACGTAVFLTELKQNSKIWIESTITYISQVLHKEDIYRTNSFSGILINSY